jgi:hypothetical protein
LGQGLDNPALRLSAKLVAVLPREGLPELRHWLLKATAFARRNHRL